MDNPETRQLPSDLHAEREVLGAIMVSTGEGVGDLIGILAADDFWSVSHQKLYRVMVELFTHDRPVTQLTVVDALRERGWYEEVGGAYAVATLASEVVSAASIVTHAQMVVNKARARHLIHAASQVLTMAYTASAEVDSIMNVAEALIFAVTSSRLASRPTVADVAMGLLEGWESPDPRLPGLPTGITALDDLLQGMQRGDMICLAAATSAGKTALALRILRHLTIDRQIPVAMFSLEMSMTQVAHRLLTADARMDAHRVRSRRFTQGDIERLAASVARVSVAPMIIHDSPSLSIFELRALARRWKRDADIRLVIVDYLQLITSTGENRQQEVAFLSRSLKEMARELAVPVLALSQLKRGIESRENKRPTLFDLRESGAIEQDSDVVLFIYRPELYGITEVHGVSTKGMAEVIIGKQRNGPTGTVNTTWIDSYATFENMDVTHTNERTKK